MPKNNLKAQVIGPEFEFDTGYLIDIHRPTPKHEGGEYVDGNMEVLSPIDHMKHHEIWREREPTLENLKAIIDQRNQVMNLNNKIQNQIRAFERRTDNDPSGTTMAYLQEAAQRFKTDMADMDNELTRFMKRMAKVDPLVKAAMGVKSCGPVTVAYMRSYIDVTKARHASSLWSYCGLHRASHERYTKGEAGGGNKTLRTKLYTFADSQMKGRGPYRFVYDSVKERLQASEKVVATRNTQGKLVESAWKDAKKSHIHGAALRAVMKHFLADYWYVARDLEGLDNGPCYAEAQLGGNHKTVDPRSRGWDW
jgi:hypothetical protein